MKTEPPPPAPPGHVPPRALIDAVENALAPYKRLLSETTLDRMRKDALLQLAAHPYPAALLRSMAPQAEQTSHVRSIGSTSEAPSAAPKKGAA